MKVKSFSLKKIMLVLMIIIVLIQFIRIDKTNPSLTEETDFVNVKHPPEGIANLIKVSCYDCHSNETIYPWYTNIAPVSWWIKDHINEARHHLNFSEWGTYSSKKADHKLKECVEMVQEGEMPLYSYTLMHSNSSLNEDQKHALSVWFESLRTYESEKEEH
jgi:hypothetical protein